MMVDSGKLTSSPLSLEDIQKIDESGLSNIDRHYLRLLAHCLGCFKSISANSLSGPIPNKADRLEWLMMQSDYINDKAFISAFLEQLDIAASQLERLAKERKMTPLELTIDELINAIIIQS